MLVSVKLVSMRAKETAAAISSVQMQSTEKTPRPGSNSGDVRVVLAGVSRRLGVGDKILRSGLRALGLQATATFAVTQSVLIPRNCHG